MSWQDALAEAARGSGLSEPAASSLIGCDDIESLTSAATVVNEFGHGQIVSYSRKVFIPLTKLCRDVCHYCTFAQPPRGLERPYMLPDEVMEVARAGAAAGCKEALFTLGDKPELRYGVARQGLADLGCETTVDYLAMMAERVFSETGLLPHINAGVLEQSEIETLRAVSVSQGTMLESASDRLGEKGQPHYGSPDKVPAARLGTIEAAGGAVDRRILYRASSMQVLGGVINGHLGVAARIAALTAGSMIVVVNSVLAGVVGGLLWRSVAGQTDDPSSLPAGADLAFSPSLRGGAGVGLASGHGAAQATLQRR